MRYDPAALAVLARKVESMSNADDFRDDDPEVLVPGRKRMYGGRPLMVGRVTFTQWQREGRAA